MDTGMESITAQRGVTLVEMLITVGIVAILGSIAIPNLSNLHRSAARAAVVNDLMHSIYLARSEAIKRNLVIGICRSVEGVKCANTQPDWSGGWIVFENTDDDQPANTDPGETVLFRHRALA